MPFLQKERYYKSFPLGENKLFKHFQDVFLHKLLTTFLHLYIYVMFEGE
jgi:hypothetical protein